MNCCPKCGCKVSEDDNFCINCGADLSSENLSMSKSKEKSLFQDLLFILVLLIIGLGIFCILNNKGQETGRTPAIDSKTIKEATTVKSENYSFDKYSIYKNSNAGIYAFNIPLSDFNKDKFVKYVQTLSRSQQGNANFVFVFNKPVKTNIIDSMLSNPQYNMPLYTTDILWKQSPYFYYSDAFGIKQSYCEITGLSQKYYERNKGLLYNETTFSHKYNLTAPKGFGLSSLNGCNPEYVADSYTIQQEMTLSTIAEMNLYNNSQNNVKKDVLKNLANEKNDTQNFSDNNIQKQEYFLENKETNLESDSPASNANTSNNSSPSLKRYMDNMQKRIKMNWFPPHINNSSAATIIFTVAKDGSLIGEPTIKQTSGIDDLDKACINAVKLAAPFKPIPEEIQQDSVDIEFSFDYNVNEI